MITIVYWEELESEFSDEAGEMAAVAGESEMLTATESMDDAFDRIKKHQKENEGRDIQYILSFWLDGEFFCHAAIAEDTPVDMCREEIVNYVKSFMH